MAFGRERNNRPENPVGIGPAGRLPFGPDGKWQGIIMPLPEGQYKIGKRGFGMQYHPIHHTNSFHGGHDIQAKSGTPILAPQDCIIDAVLPNHGGAGNYLTISGGLYKYGFMHLSKFADGLRKGMHVKQGQIIGYVGSTGLSRGPHLHYEVYSLKNGEKLDPKITAMDGAKTISLADAQAITAGRTTVADIMQGRQTASAMPMQPPQPADTKTEGSYWWNKASAAPAQAWPVRPSLQG